MEIFPCTLRGRGLTVTLASTYIALIVGQFVNPIAIKAIEWQYYIVFCCLLGALFVMVWSIFPETKDHTLEEIAVFDGKKHSPTEKTKDGHSVVCENLNEKIVEVQIESLR